MTTRLDVDRLATIDNLYSALDRVREALDDTAQPLAVRVNDATSILDTVTRPVTQNPPIRDRLGPSAR